MAVWLTMDMSYVGPGDYANTSKVAVRVNVHWSHVSYNRDGGALSVTVDGTTENFKVAFNAGETSSGSQNLYAAYWNISHSGSKTVYASATFQATNNTTATPASAELYLSASGASGGSSGGGSSGGDSGDDDDDDGGNTGGGSSGGTSYDYVYALSFNISAHCFIKLYENGVFLENVYGSRSFPVSTNIENTYTFEAIADQGYKLSSFYVNGVSCVNTGVGSLTPGDSGDYKISASAVLDVSTPDGDNQGWVIGGGYDANGPPHTGEGYQNESRYILVKQAEGTKVTVTRVYTEAGAYLGELVDGELFQDDYGTWYKYEAHKWDYFTIEAEALPGYNIDTHNVDGRTFNFYASGIIYGTLYHLDGGWKWDTNYYGAKVARIYTTATKNDDSGKDYGSGSGTLYFDAVECEAQYAVDFIYSENKFYVTNVKIKTPLYGPYNTTFDLFVKINDVVIHSGTKTCRIDTSDWYDLSISGLAGITDKVEITLFGTADYPAFKYSVASPTVQTIIISYSIKGAFITSNGTDFLKSDVYIDNGTGWDVAVICVSENGEWALLE